MNNGDPHGRLRIPQASAGARSRTNTDPPRSANSAAAAANMSRAERFEDEKRRIVESCFGKKDSEGNLLESYITHIRIVEDAQHPSTPPPPESGPENKKPRLIIVAVRKSGRVRMHKARENNNATFSIGKTWVLDDLTSIQSYVGSTPTTPEEERFRDWAGGVGFTVNIGKPYFWQASTTKEKEFFIGSLVKIFRKYTGGKLPELVGFDAREMEQLTNGPSPARPTTSDSTQRTPSSQMPPSTGAPIPPKSLARTASIEARMRASEGRGAPDSVASSPRTPANVSAMSPPPLTSQTSRGQLRNGSFTGSSQVRDMSQEGRPGRPSVGSDTSRLRQNSNIDSRSSSSNARPKTPESNYASPIPRNDTPPRTGLLASPPERKRPTFPGKEGSSDSFMRDGNSERSFSSSNNVDAQNGDIHGQPQLGQRMGRDEPAGTGYPPRAFDKNLDRAMTGTPETLDSASFKSAKSKDDVSYSPSVPTPPSEPVNGVKEEQTNRAAFEPVVAKKSNKDIAKAFRKAATAYNAFRPKGAVAAEAQAEEKSKPEATVNGNLNGAKEVSQNIIPDQPSSRAETPKPVNEVPEVKITRAATDLAESGAGEASQAPPEHRRGESQGKANGASQKAMEVRRQRRRSGISAKQIAALGIDPALLEGRSMDFESILSEFGWEGEGVHKKKVDLLQSEIKRELGRVEAGSWLGHLEQKDERVGIVETMLDKAIAECEELEGLLTLYSVELSTLNDDVAFIEAQSQGLQVQTANQKLLHTELENLLRTISIPSSKLQSLRDASLESSNGLEIIEASLALLYKAMVTIDPSLRQGSDVSIRPSEDGSINSRSFGGYANSEVGSMRALRERKDGYRNESISFLRRVKQFMSVKFQSAIADSVRAIERDRDGQLTKRPGDAKIKPENHDLAREQLWRYSPLMLFCREVDMLEWEDMLRAYERSAKSMYQEEFREHVFACKRAARKPSGEEQELLFTAAEKESEGLATTARKLTVKRSQTLAKTLRSTQADGEGKKAGERSQGGTLYAYEAFNAVLDGVVPITFMEQNFVVEFFHASSIESSDFTDAIAIPPTARKGRDLRVRKLFDPDRTLAKRVLDVMDEMFNFLPSDLQNLVEWAIKADPLQGVGVLQALERKMAELDETNQEFLTRNLSKVHDRLVGLFQRFLDDQIRAIEETKVKIKKRKGVIAFMKTFPHFSMAIENMLSSTDVSENLDIREMINGAYDRIIKAMFESLQTIAKDSPTAAGGGQSAGQGLGDPEDKEALNYHILLIENMNHYLEEVDTKLNPVLEEWEDKAAAEMMEHMDLYLGAVIRRPLGKLLDFIESTESQLSTHLNPSEIPTRASHSRSTFKKLLGTYDGKEIRRGIETLKKRVEKHFGDADDPGLSRSLVSKVLKECEKKYVEIQERSKKIIDEVYEGGLELGWGREDIAAAFRK